MQIKILTVIFWSMANVKCKCKMYVQEQKGDNWLAKTIFEEKEQVSKNQDLF